jgi:hypothetical protein
MNEIIPRKHNRLGGFDLLPAAPDTCPECAVKHEPEEPHNQQSLFYKYKFFNEYGRWPTWEDAMSHCSVEMKALWIAELAKEGVIVEERGVYMDSNIAFEIE